MKIKGPDVVAFWGGINSVLWFIHLDYGGGTVPTVPFAEYGCSVALVELVAVAAFWTLRRRGDTRFVSPAPRSSRIAFWGASCIGFVVLGLVFRPWLIIGAVYPALGVALELVSAAGGSRTGSPQPTAAPAVSGSEVRPEAAARLVQRSHPTKR